MKRLNLVAVLLSIALAHYSHLVYSASKTSMIAGLQWGYMQTYIKTDKHVYHLEEDKFLPGHILFSDGYFLKTVHGKTQHLVAGSSQGYAEGSLTQAKFSGISGFLQTNSSHVIVVDFGNDCLRHISRITNMTSPFVGKCESSGFIDGRYENSAFNGPWSVILDTSSPGEAIVTDYINQALRSVVLATGVVRTLIKDLPSHPDGAAFDSGSDSVFLSMVRSLGKYNVKTSTFTTLTPIANNGGLDGDFRTASFEDADGIICMSEVCIVADREANKLRVLDFEHETVYSICSGSYATVDGEAVNCSLRHPLSLLLKSDTLYIGEDGAIRSFSVHKVRENVPCKDINIKLSAEEQEKCLEVTPGHFVCMTPGYSRYSIPAKNCTIKINVTKELDVCQKNPCLNSGSCTIEKNNTYTCTCRDGWAGANCQTQKSACTFNPCKNYGRCLPINNTFSCSCEAGWTGIICEREVHNTTCAKNIYGTADPETKKAKISLPDGHKITLPVGRYSYEQHIPDSTACVISIHVLDPLLKLRLDFSANYKIPCTLFGDFNEFTRSIAQMRYSQINLLTSSRCNKSANFDVTMSCTMDVLQIIWPTDCLFDGSLSNERERILSIIDDNLKKIKQLVLELVIPNHKPPIIQPSLNHLGLPTSVVLSPVCLEGYVYVNSTDTCQSKS